MKAKGRRPVILQRGTGYADLSPDPLRIGQMGGIVGEDEMPERGSTGTLNLQRFLCTALK
jgi:hypothetical protein